MSKTTAVLLTILVIVIGILLFILYGPKQNQIIRSLIQPDAASSTSADTTLSLSTNTQIVHTGQTVIVAVIIHSPDVHPDLTQIELAYDPLTVTVNTVSPGTFFTNPTVALQKIDPDAGRVTYALRCSTKTTHCVNDASSTVATLSISINPYSTEKATTISFLPKSVVRIATGRDILKRTKGLELTISKSLNTDSSSSATASQAANYVPITPTQ